MNVKHEMVPIATTLLAAFVLIISLAVFAIGTSRFVHGVSSEVTMIGEFEHEKAENLYRTAIIENLPGAVIEVDALSGVVRDLNVGALEIFGSRGLQIGQRMFSAIEDPELRDKHFEIFGEQAKGIWEKRQRKGAFTVTRQIRGQYRNITIAASELHGDPIYNVFVDPRAFASRDAGESVTPRELDINKQ